MQPHERGLKAQWGLRRCWLGDALIVRVLGRACRRVGGAGSVLVEDRRGVRGVLATVKAGLPRDVERALQRVVQRPQSDLVAGADGAWGAEEVRAGPALLVCDDRPQHAVDLGVKRLDRWVVLVEAASIDAHDDLRSSPVERVALQVLEPVAADLAVEMARPRPTFVR